MSAHELELFAPGAIPEPVRFVRSSPTCRRAGRAWSYGCPMCWWEGPDRFQPETATADARCHDLLCPGPAADDELRPWWEERRRRELAAIADQVAGRLHFAEPPQPRRMKKGGS